MSGQSIVDRINAAKYSIAGRGLAKSVCKATTEEILGPKKKHVDYLVQCTKEPNVSIPVLANLLIERTQEQKWVVVFKSLITIHNLMNYGNERFTQYLASNTGFHLDGFSDKTTVQAADMSKFIQRYAKYIQEKSASYRINAFDFCKIKRGKDDGVLRMMNGEKLLKTLPTLQSQLDALIGFDATPNELTNNVIHTCFILLFKDLIRLFACYNDGIINLLEKYFEMNKKQCKEGLDIYKKFLVRMDQVSEFLKVAENMGVDRGDIPDLAKAPSSLLDALESHLASLEGKKGGSTPTGSGSADVSARPAGFTNTVNNFSKATSGGVGASSVSPTLGGITDDERKKALEQEEQTMQQLKMAASPTQPMPQQHVNQQRSPTMPQTQQSTNPFASAITTSSANETVDLFGSSATFQAQHTSMPSDDLLGLGTGSSNPFATASMTTTSPSPGQPANHFMGQSSATNPWAGTDSAANNNINFDISAPATNNEINFEAAFGNQNQPGYDGFGDVMQPAAQRNQQQQGTRLIKQDLDSSLASIVGNLNINGPGQHLKKTEHQWSPSANKGQKTGGANWQAPMPAATFQSWSQPGMQPGIQAHPTTSGVGNGYIQPAMSGVGNGYMPPQPIMSVGYSHGYSQPPMMTTMNMNYNSQAYIVPLHAQQTGPRPAMGIQPQQPGMFPAGTQQQQPMMAAQQPNLFQQPTKPQQSQPLDPFGSL